MRKNIKKGLLAFLASLMTLGMAFGGVACDVNVNIGGLSGIDGLGSESTENSENTEADGSESGENTDGEESVEDGSSDEENGEGASQEGSSEEDNSDKEESDGAEESSDKESGESSPADSKTEEGEIPDIPEDKDSTSDDLTDSDGEENSEDSKEDGSMVESMDSDGEENSEDSTGDEEQKTESVQYTLSEDGKYYIVTGFVMGEETDIVIPSTYEGLPVQEIGAGAFRDCDGLTSVTLPDGVTVIGESAFENCSGMTTIKCGILLSAIGENAFLGCGSLTDVYFNGTMAEAPEFTIGDGNDALYSTTVHFTDGVAGEDSGEDDGGSGEVVEQSKTVLYVHNFVGGYGSEWIEDAIRYFEEIHNETSFEPGKKGVKVMLNNTKEGAASLLEWGEPGVYFHDSVTGYYDLVRSGRLLDITQAVVETNEEYGEHTSIENKMTEQQTDYFKVDGKYYAIPHASTARGLVYDVDLFEEKGYYFKDGYDIATGDCFISSETDDRSAGPDGTYGTMDDGLPVTYAEFFMLCDYMVEKGDIPMTWAGTYLDYYLGGLYASLVANSLGEEQALLNYTMNGTANSLGSVDSSGNFVKDTSSTEIVPENAFELYRQVERYEALTFFEKLVNTSAYYSPKALNSAFSYFDAQMQFLASGKTNSSASIAMLAEGVWWQNEATEIFSSMAKKDEAWSKENRRFGWMPMPRAESAEGQKSVYLDSVSSLCFASANIEESLIPVVIEFMKFMNTDQMLAEFTLATGAPKALQYEMTEEQLGNMTYFSQNVLDFRENADVVYSTDLVVDNQVLFAESDLYMAQFSNVYSNPVRAMLYEQVTAEDYFNGMIAYYGRTWKERLEALEQEG